MDYAQLTASLVGSLAWPVAIVLALLLFRNHLTELLPHLKVKYKDLELRFDQAEKVAATLPAPPAPLDVEPTPEEKSRFEQVAELSPRAAILELRNELEAAVRAAVSRLDYPASSPVNLLTGTRVLRKAGVIDSSTSSLLDDLRVIGNDAAHSVSTEFTKADALRYRALADDVIPHLRFPPTGLTHGSE